MFLCDQYDLELFGSNFVNGSLATIVLQYGVKIVVMTSFKDTYYIEILPNVKKSKGGKTVLYFKN